MGGPITREWGQGPRILPPKRRRSDGALIGMVERAQNPLCSQLSAGPEYGCPALPTPNASLSHRLAGLLPNGSHIIRITSCVQDASTHGTVGRLRHSAWLAGTPDSTWIKRLLLVSETALGAPPTLRLRRTADRMMRPMPIRLPSAARYARAPAAAGNANGGKSGAPLRPMPMPSASAAPGGTPNVLVRSFPKRPQHRPTGAVRWATESSASKRW